MLSERLSPPTLIVQMTPMRTLFAIGQTGQTLTISPTGNITHPPYGQELHYQEYVARISVSQPADILERCMTDQIKVHGRHGTCMF